MKLEDLPPEIQDMARTVTRLTKEYAARGVKIQWALCAKCHNPAGHLVGVVRDAHDKATIEQLVCSVCGVAEGVTDGTIDGPAPELRKVRQ